MKKLLPLMLLAFAVWLWQDRFPDLPFAPGGAPAADAGPASAERFTSGAWVGGSGIVTRMLPDDNDGSRHQRFILRLASGRTLLIAHNIDLAPRIASLREGDTVSFYGEYQANDRGGVIHWTHRDPRGGHPGGWLKHDGGTYR